MTMRAAVVHSFGSPPRYETIDAPKPSRGDEAVVDVVAAGLHRRVRTDASGRHYTSTGALPMIPGIDGVGRLPDGRTVYFASAGGRWGSMAERALVNPRRMILLPADSDPVNVAAAMNPAMSSWVALRCRATLRPGQSVLVLGATGVAGTMAVQVARHLGAGKVVGAGRNPERLAALAAAGADEVVSLAGEPEVIAQRLAGAAADADIVIDYLWGPPAAAAMHALLTGRPDRSRPLDWVQIGATAGPAIELESVVLRSANLRIQGSGQGAVSPGAYLAELPALVEEVNAGTVSLSTRRVALSDVERTWGQPDAPGERIVFVP